LGVEPYLVFMTRYFIFFESFCPVHVGVPSLMRGKGLSFVRVTVCSIKSLSVCTIIYILPVINNFYIQYVYTRLLSVQAQYSRLCPIFSSIHYSSSLVTWTVVCLTATKFKPLIFSVSGFVLFDVAKNFIIMILHDFCLLHA
jgi:hypothetical protein